MYSIQQEGIICEIKSGMVRISSQERQHVQVTKVEWEISASLAQAYCLILFC